MKIVASTPDSKLLAGDIKDFLDAVSPDSLREAVETLSVPRVYGTVENEGVRRLIIDLFASSGFARPSIEEDDFMTGVARLLVHAVRSGRRRPGEGAGRDGEQDFRIREGLREGYRPRAARRLSSTGRGNLGNPCPKRRRDS